VEFNSQPYAFALINNLQPTSHRADFHFHIINANSYNKGLGSITTIGKHCLFKLAADHHVKTFCLPLREQPIITHKIAEHCLQYKKMAYRKYKKTYPETKLFPKEARTVYEFCIDD